MTAASVLDRSARLAPGARGPRASALARAAVAVPVLVSVVLTAWGYDSKPLWRDEVYTFVTAGRDLPSMLRLLAVRDAGLTGYYLLMHGWLAVSEASWWMRLPGALATPVAVGAVAVLGRRVGGPAVGLLGGLLMALAPIVVRQAQDARPYALVLAAVTLTALLLLRTADDPRRRRWLAVAVAVLAALAVALHPLVAVPAVAGLFAAALLRPGAADRVRLVAAGAPAGVIGTALVAVGARQAVERPPAAATLPEYFTFWRIVAASPALGLVVLALAVAGAVALRRRPEALLLIAWAVVPVAAVVALGLSGGYFNSRYATACLPAVCVLAAAGLVAARGLLPRRRPGWAAAVVAAAVLAVLAVQGPPALAYRAQPYYFDDAPGAAAEVAAGAQPGDAVVYVGPVARPLVSPHLPAGLEGGGRLDDVLLVAPWQRSDTLGGQELRGRAKQEALAPYGRVWVVGTMATATVDLARESWTAEAATSGREMASRHDHGWVRVELWVAPGAAPAA